MIAMPDADVPKSQGPFTSPDGQSWKTWGRYTAHMKKYFPKVEIVPPSDKPPINPQGLTETNDPVSVNPDTSTADAADLDAFNKIEKGKEIHPLGKPLPKILKVISYQDFHDAFIAIPELINEIINWIGPDSEYIGIAEIWRVDEEEYQAVSKLIYKILLKAKPEWLVDVDADGVLGIILCLIPVIQIYGKKARMTLIEVNRIKDIHEKKKIAEGIVDEPKKGKGKDRSRKS